MGNIAWRGRDTWRGALIGVAVAAAGTVACGDDAGADFDAAQSSDAAVDASPPDADLPDALPPPDGADLCGFEAALVEPGGTHIQYVFDTTQLPTTATQASLYGIDLDGDPMGRPDNALGQIMATLASSSDLDFQESSDRAVSRGEIITLVDVQATSLTSATGVGIGIAHGRNPSPAPCLDGNDQVCGQHLDGSGSFDVMAHPQPALLGSQIVAGKLMRSAPGIATIQLMLFGGDAPVALVLYGARLEAEQITASSLASGKLGGGVVEEDLDNHVIPAMRASITSSIEADCTGEPIDCPGASCRPCGCPEGESDGRNLLDLFDEYGATLDDPPDCEITVEEFANNSLISSLLAPDLDLFDCTGGGWPNGCCFDPRVDGVKDSLSLGVGFSAVAATFLLP